MILGTPVSHNALLPMDFVKSLLGVQNMHIMEEGPSIPDNRNKIFEQARLYGDSLLFIDSDMVFTPQDVKLMEELLKDHDIVSGVCAMSFDSHQPAIFENKDGKFYPITPQNEIFEIDACGAAFLGISARVIQTLIRPFTLIEDGKGGYHGEDISFCITAKKEGFKIFCEPKLSIGHIKSKVIYYGQT